MYSALRSAALANRTATATCLGKPTAMLHMPNFTQVPLYWFHPCS
ncbi:hypothetical protein [Streptomyces wedmorensis]